MMGLAGRPYRRRRRANCRIVSDQRPRKTSHLKAPPALARLRKLFLDANSPIADGYMPTNAVIREWANLAQLNNWATAKVRYQGWTYASANGVVQQADLLMAALERHAEDSGEDPFDPAFPTANLIEPSILPDAKDASSTEAGE